MRIHQIHDHQNGFILLEVLVAIGLVSGVWMSSIQAYQVLVLSLMKQKQKQALVRQDFDRYELAEQIRANLINHEDLNHDLTRMPHRHRTLHPVVKPSFAN